MSSGSSVVNPASAKSASRAPTSRPYGVLVVPPPERARTMAREQVCRCSINGSGLTPSPNTFQMRATLPPSRSSRCNAPQGRNGINPVKRRRTDDEIETLFGTFNFSKEFPHFELFPSPIDREELWLAACLLYSRSRGGDRQEGVSVPARFRLQSRDGNTASESCALS